LDRAAAQPRLDRGPHRPRVIPVRAQTAAPSHPAGVTASRYASVRDLTEVLAAPLSPEDQTVQSMPDVSPTKWHRAHTTWFFETFLLRPDDPGYAPFHPMYEYLFNSYYETVGPRHPRPRRGLLSRPSASEVGEYRRHVDDAMARLLDDDLPPARAALVELGLQHEQQHQELLLMDVKHVLSVNPMRPAYRGRGHGRDVADRDATPSQWIEHGGGLADVGHDGTGFAFDNELPRHQQHLAGFALADRPVSCGEWLAFVDDGGYRRPEWWLSDGWATVQAEGWEAPLYWERDGATWSVFTLAGPRPVDPAEPVCHVSYYEADAYARWCGARLPTEAEWEVVASKFAPLPGGIDLAVLHPSPPAGGTPGFGEVWEWTASAYLPYPGFTPAPGAVGEYNGKFMVNQHVLRGGSCVTPAGHARPSYRNFFPPAARWPFTGVRLARDLDVDVAGSGR
jgi:ergothioneine biosynthesis protein EgtB